MWERATENTGKREGEVARIHNLDLGKLPQTWTAVGTCDNPQAEFMGDSLDGKNVCGKMDGRLMPWVAEFCRKKGSRSHWMQTMRLVLSIKVALSSVEMVHR